MGPGPLDRSVTVALVEDTDVVVEGVRTWLRDDPDQRARIVSVGRTIEEVLDALTDPPDVLVLDLELDGELVTDRIPALADAGYVIVVFSVHVKPLIVRAVMDAGAVAFLDKRAEREYFVDVLVDAAAHRPVVTPSMAGAMLDAPQFSAREREVLLYLFQGLSHASIARRIRKTEGEPISPVTVKQYVNRARAKLAAQGRPCSSTFALLARCIELGLIRPEEIDDHRPG